MRASAGTATVWVPSAHLPEQPNLVAAGVVAEEGVAAAVRVGLATKYRLPIRSTPLSFETTICGCATRATNKETQLTNDGVKDFGYATDNAGWTHSDRPILLWSPDSKRIATFQQDQRGVGEMYLVDTRVGHPTLQAWKYPLPGDNVVAMIQRVIINVESPRVIRLEMPPDQHRSSLCDDIACRGGEWADVQWSDDGEHLAFVSTSRDHRKEELFLADAATGKIRSVMQETVPTFFESGNGRVNWHYLPQSNEIIWFSERDNWGHLYLYDLTTGKLKHQITKGDWNVTQLLRVDKKNRMLYFLGVGKESGRDPYFSHFYSVGFDGAKIALLTPENGNHDITLSPSGGTSSTVTPRPIRRRRRWSAAPPVNCSPPWRRRTSQNWWQPVGSPYPIYGERPRRHYRYLRPDVQAHQSG